MTVISISISTKSNQTLFARQFIEIPRGRIEALLQNFHRLSSSSSNLHLHSSIASASANKQHTFIEDDGIRYLYQNLENGLILLLITTKHSNVLSDLESLNICSRLVHEVVCNSSGFGNFTVAKASSAALLLAGALGSTGGLGGGSNSQFNLQPQQQQQSIGASAINEAEIRKKTFELIFAFDEVFSGVNGRNELVSLNAIGNILNMESHDELIQDMISKNKEREAKEAAKLKSKQIELQRKEALKQQQLQSKFIGSGSSGIDNNSNPFFSASAPSENLYASPVLTATSMNSSNAPASTGRGMKLGASAAAAATNRKESLKGKGLSQPLASNTKEANIPPRGNHSISSPSSSIPQSSFPFVVTIEEKINLLAHKDGGIDSMEVKGDLLVRVNDEHGSKANIKLDLSKKDSRLQLKTHPNIDKTLFNTKNVLSLKDPTKSFPVGMSLGLLKWRLTSNSEADVPFTVNCWPSSSNVHGVFDINIEYSLENPSLRLEEVIISIPMESEPRFDDSFLLNDKDKVGITFFDKIHKVLQWQIPKVSTESNPTASIEFQAAGREEDSFFPVNIYFKSTTTSFSNIQILSANQNESGTEIDMEKQILFSTEEYNVV